MRYEILDDDGNVINTIVADESFVEQMYPGHYRELPEPVPNYVSQNKTEAMSRLQSTDWVELPSVSDPETNPHLLNVTEFLAYRSAVRAIAVNPPTEPAVFPELPKENWSSL
jgi:hypothetical protein